MAVLSLYGYKTSSVTSESSCNEVLTRPARMSNLHKSSNPRDAAVSGFLIFVHTSVCMYAYNVPACVSSSDKFENDKDLKFGTHTGVRLVISG